MTIFFEIIEFQMYILAGIPDYPDIITVSSSNPDVLKVHGDSMGLYKKVLNLWVNNRPVWSQIIGGSNHFYSTGKSL